ncbi:hypothetical protein [Blastomonas aquatica]|uniref:Uncharacterized protein n=1 Tax=Blastomonas aquatica TaxID=1510276 RepID=A0ABQ1J0H2_9SPHN|nr:hypothetical protein [Blastomonas aquatica]GGB54238.1 hypothetical protein GCM10010833_06110 [Blastomonas aquatica]
MNAYHHALCWAVAILGVAVLNVADLISDGTAQALFTGLPILAVMSVARRGRCLRSKAC